MTCKNQCASCKRRDPIAEQMAAAHEYMKPNGQMDIEDNVLRIDIEVPTTTKVRFDSSLKVPASR